MKLNRLLVFDGALELNKTAIESTKNASSTVKSMYETKEKCIYIIVKIRNNKYSIISSFL